MPEISSDSSLWTSISDDGLRGWVQSANEVQPIIDAFEARTGISYVNGFKRKYGPHKKVRFRDIRDSVIPQDGVPFVTLSHNSFSCMYGRDRNASRRIRAKEERDRLIKCGLPTKRVYNKVKGSCKKNCPACIDVKEVIRFTDFKDCNTEWVKKNASRTIRQAMNKKERLNTEMRIYIRLPSTEDHQKTHKIGKTSSVAVADVITRMKRQDQNGWYELEWADGHTAQFPYVFLFDNCRCPDCYHPMSYQRSVLMANVDPDVQPTGEKIVKDGEHILVTWPNGHVGMYPAEWLKKHLFGRGSHDPLDSIELKPWGCEKASRLASFKYKDVMEDNTALYSYLKSLLTDGLTLLRETPGEEGVVAKIIERIAWCRTTIYGNVFNVITSYDACSLAYTAKALGMHNDLPGFYFTPGIQMLHCIKQVDSEGGDNQFVDGLRIAEQLKKEDPETFKTLTTMRVDFRTLGEEYVKYHTMTRRPIIEYDIFGNFAGINYNDGVRSPYWSLPVDQIKNGYRALKTFHRAMYSEKNFINYKMEKGDMVMFDNRRVLHGRHGFKVEVAEGEKSKTRHLEGGYLDWDGVKSKIRLLYEEIHGLDRL